MHTSTRWYGVTALVVLGCGTDPKPLTGQATWGDGCPMNLCPPQTHATRGSSGSPTIDVDCQLRPAAGGYSIFFRIAALSGGQQNFDDSSEGLLASGFVPAVGQEIRTSGSEGALVSVRGLGWQIRSAAAGPTNSCHVFIDAISNGGFSGRISCINVRDDSSPSMERLIRGGVGASMFEYGDFVFTNCSTGS
jgi:hypothetical protein